MKKLLLPILLMLVGTGSGVGAALMLKSDPPPEAGHDLAAGAPCGDPAADPVATEGHAPAMDAIAAIAAAAGSEFAPLASQFVVPVMEQDHLVAMMAIMLSVEVPLGGSAKVYAVEPRLRDRLLQDMFQHSNIGGFSGNYTATDKMRILRQDLLRTTRDIMGDAALDILILDIKRQDV
ncbi:MAG: flagellar basal body-associated protein FliL [Alphaproteobacteria bacterium]|nr:flagellar basal body-associated protein FliL [Alphaproteobacteria bacterium]